MIQIKFSIGYSKLANNLMPYLGGIRVANTRHCSYSIEAYKKTHKIQLRASHGRSPDELSLKNIVDLIDFQDLVQGVDFDS